MSTDPASTEPRQYPPVPVDAYTDLVAHHAGAGTEDERAALRDVILLYSHGIPALAQRLGNACSVCVHAGAHAAAFKVLEPQAASAPRPPLGTLFTSTQAGASAGQRARYSAAVLRALRTEFDIDVVGHLHGEPLVRLGTHPHYYTSWYLCDNGGELNVGPVNRDDEMRPVAYCSFSARLDAGTVAYRVAAVLRGEAIDYDLRHPKRVAG